MAGADVVGGDRLDDYLARYRIRYTGGVDGVAARAAREDLGADAILTTSVILWGGTSPRVGARDAARRPADDPGRALDGRLRPRRATTRPGSSASGIVSDPAVLQAEALRRLGASLEELPGQRAASAVPCPGAGGAGRGSPTGPGPTSATVATVAVLPFVNETRRRGAGRGRGARVRPADRQRRGLPAGGAGHRPRRAAPPAHRHGGRGLAGPGAHGLDDARRRPGRGGLRLRLRGRGGEPERPTSRCMVIDRKTGRMVWESTSYNKGDDSETLFGLRKVGTAPRLTCRMAREVIDGMTGARSDARAGERGGAKGPTAPDGMRNRCARLGRSRQSCPRNFNA